MALKHLHGVDLGLDLKILPQLSRLVSAACRVPVSPWKPIVGSNIFAHESGIHVAGLLRSEKTFEPFSPEEIGASRTLVLGKHSGSHGIQAALKARGREISAERAQRLLPIVRSRAVANTRPVTPEELERIDDELR